MTSDSEFEDGVADIFWPGYVDAVTNLALNLLFIVALMFIITVGATLGGILESNAKGTAGVSDGHEKTAVILNAKEQAELSKVQAELNRLQGELQKALGDKAAAEKLAEAMKAGGLADEESLKKLLADFAKAQAELSKAQAELKKLQGELQKALGDKAAAEKLAAAMKAGGLADEESLKKLLADFVKAQAESNKAQAELNKAQAELKKLQGELQKALAEKGASQSGGAGDSKADTLDVVKATQKRQSVQQTNALQESALGVVVEFAPDAVEMTDQEAGDLMQRLAKQGPINGPNWQVQVAVTKGFSGAVRMAYYRVNAVRNVLLRHGVPASAITIRVMESSQPGANNTRVLVRRGS